MLYNLGISLVCGTNMGILILTMAIWPFILLEFGSSFKFGIFTALPKACTLPLGTLIGLLCWFYCRDVWNRVMGCTMDWLDLWTRFVVWGYAPRGTYD